MKKLFSWLWNFLGWGQIVLSTTTVFSTANQLHGQSGSKSSPTSVKQTIQTVEGLLVEAEQALGKKKIKLATRLCEQIELQLGAHHASVNSDFLEVSQKAETLRINLGKF